MARIRLKQLESELEAVSVFSEPKILLEQYPTTPHIAGESTVLYCLHQYTGLL